MSTSRYSRDSYTTPPPTRHVLHAPGAPRHNSTCDMITSTDMQPISMHPNFFQDMQDMQPRKAQSAVHGHGHGNLLPAFDFNLPLSPPPTPPTKHEFTSSQPQSNPIRPSTPTPSPVAAVVAAVAPIAPPPSPRRSPRKSLKRMHSHDSCSSSISSSSSTWTKSSLAVITRSRAKLNRTISLPKDSSPYHIKQGLHSPSLVAMSQRLGMGW